MACYHPVKAWRIRQTGKIVFKNPGYIDAPPPRRAGADELTLPCGGCTGCRLERSRQWAIRCHHEASLHEDNSFVTLTYNDASLPNDPELGQAPSGTLVKSDFQRFMKRLRKHSGAGIRFYMCGEYGPKLGRPHYHACIFNYKPPDLRFHKRDPETQIDTYTSNTLSRIWGKGFTLTGQVTFESAAYVARYIMEKISGSKSAIHYETADPITGEIFKLLPEFTMMSLKPGIGHNWFNQYKEDVYNDDYVIIKGKKMRPPRYYDRLLEAEDPKRYAALKSARVHNAQQHAHDNTPARLQVRETIQNARLNHLPRNL